MENYTNNYDKTSPQLIDADLLSTDSISLSVPEDIEKSSASDFIDESHCEMPTFDLSNSNMVNKENTHSTDHINNDLESPAIIKKKYETLESTPDGYVTNTSVTKAIRENITFSKFAKDNTLKKEPLESNGPITIPDYKNKKTNNKGKTLSTESGLHMNNDGRNSTGTRSELDLTLEQYDSIMCFGRKEEQVQSEQPLQETDLDMCDAISLQDDYNFASDNRSQNDRSHNWKKLTEKSGNVVAVQNQHSKKQPLLMLTEDCVIENTVQDGSYSDVYNNVPNIPGNSFSKAQSNFSQNEVSTQKITEIMYNVDQYNLQEGIEQPFPHACYIPIETGCRPKTPTLTSEQSLITPGAILPTSHHFEVNSIYNSGRRSCLDIVIAHDNNKSILDFHLHSVDSLNKCKSKEFARSIQSLSHHSNDASINISVNENDKFPSNHENELSRYQGILPTSHHSRDTHTANSACKIGVDISITQNDKSGRSYNVNLEDKQSKPQLELVHSKSVPSSEKLTQSIQPLLRNSDVDISFSKNPKSGISFQVNTQDPLNSKYQLEMKRSKSVPSVQEIDKMSNPTSHHSNDVLVTTSSRNSCVDISITQNSKSGINLQVDSQDPLNSKHQFKNTRSKSVPSVQEIAQMNNPTSHHSNDVLETPNPNTYSNIPSLPEKSMFNSPEVLNILLGNGANPDQHKLTLNCILSGPKETHIPTDAVNRSGSGHSRPATGYSSGATSKIEFSFAQSDVSRVCIKAGTCNTPAWTPEPNYLSSPQQAPNDEQLYCISPQGHSKTGSPQTHDSPEPVHSQQEENRAFVLSAIEIRSPRELSPRPDMHIIPYSVTAQEFLSLRLNLGSPHSKGVNLESRLGCRPVPFTKESAVQSLSNKDILNVTISPSFLSQHEIDTNLSTNLTNEDYNVVIKVYSPLLSRNNKCIPGNLTPITDSITPNSTPNIINSPQELTYNVPKEVSNPLLQEQLNRVVHQPDIECQIINQPLHPVHSNVSVNPLSTSAQLDINHTSDLGDQYNLRLERPESPATSPVTISAGIGSRPTTRSACQTISQNDSPPEANLGDQYNLLLESPEPPLAGLVSIAALTGSRPTSPLLARLQEGDNTAVRPCKRHRMVGSQKHTQSRSWMFDIPLCHYLKSFFTREEVCE